MTEHPDGLSAFRDAYLDYLEGARKEPPSPSDLPEQQRRTAEAFVESITAARSIGALPPRPPTKQLLYSIEERLAGRTPPGGGLGAIDPRRRARLEAARERRPPTPADSREAKPMDNRRARAIDLFRYLRGVAELRLSQTLDVDDWEMVIWLHDLVEPPNCRTCLDDERTTEALSEWSRVERPAPPPDPPPLPPLLQPWVDQQQIVDWRGAPALRREPKAGSQGGSAAGGPGHSPTGPPEDDPKIRRAWSTYQDRWVDWAAEREGVESEHEAYSKFFVMHNRVAQLGEQYEVVVAAGLLNWRLSDRTIRRHLVTTPASLSYEPDSGLISVAPPEMGEGRIQLEDEMVPAGSHPPADVIRGIRDQLDGADGPFDDPVQASLRQWAQAADKSGTFSQSHRPSNKTSATPEVRFAPALILRRRRQASLRRTYDEIIDRLTEGEEIPATVDSLVTDTAEAASEGGVDARAVARPFAESERLFFPLATNPQQRRIVEELGRRQGVVVQGPPGTGKSHTIANLVSHSLATGKRVLVTSHTERALRVLKDLLPDDVRDLAVSVLGAGREGAADLQRSANALLARRQDPDRDVVELDGRIMRLTSELHELEDERDRHRQKLARLRAAASTASQLRSGYRGPIGEIAQDLAAERNAHGWLPDRVSGPMPIRYEELLELRSLVESVQDIDPKLESHHLPPPGELPTVGEMTAVRDAKQDAARQLDVLEGDSAVADRLRRSSIDLVHLAELLRQHDAADRAARRRSEPWLEEVLTDLDQGRTKFWDTVRRSTRSYLHRDFGHPYDHVDPSAVEPERLLHLIGQTDNLIEHLRAGGRLAGFLRKRSKVARHNGEVLNVAHRLGSPVDDLQSAEHLRAVLEEFLAAHDLTRQWGQRLEDPRGPLVAVRARLSDPLETLDHVAAVCEARDRLSELAGALLGDPVDTAADVAHLQAVLELAEARNAHDEAVRDHEQLLRRLTAMSNARAHPTFLALFGAARELEVEGYAALLEELQGLAHQREQMERCRELKRTLSAASPRFATSVVEGASDLPEADALKRAWGWSWAMSEIETLRDASENELIERLDRAEREITEYTKALTSARAWRHALDGLTDYEEQELKAYQQALGRFGKGLGKHAATHRQEAQRHLANCQTAVRAWIMPTYRVAETLRAEPESFDLVIVDEASQSGVDALFLFWLGKQMVVVGDDNQISPSNVGISVTGVGALQQQYLRSLGLRDLLGIDNSLFDQAKVRYAGEVWLTEHFRCMPEIIEFSNRRMYAPQQRRLEPLRQFGNSRLPPLQRRHVPHGQREGSSRAVINRAEAAELIDMLLECHNDPQYEGLTFGVIALLGGQARYIESRLLPRLPSEAWEERRLRCGDAYDFQGDERDVIFLSMVTSLETGRNSIPKLGNRSDEQRFNVAASRARDQMWLFHSMTPEQLNPECVRFALLNHFLEPPALDVKPFAEQVERDVRHPAFDSLFEQRVFLDIRERGYVVRPQVEVYGRRIDIVVAGSHGKLAVECDGAAWHGAERYAADLARQRDLERAGWTFFRVRDIDYYLDRERALEPLWQLLSERRILPRGMGSAPSRTEAVT